MQVDEDDDENISMIDKKYDSSIKIMENDKPNIDEAPQNQPFLSYLDSKSPIEIEEAINYFSKNIQVIDDNILNKLIGFLTDDLCSPLLLATIGNAIIKNQSLLDVIHYNAIQSYVLEYFSNIIDEYPFFRLPHLACAAIDFIAKYVGLSKDNVQTVLDEGILDSISHILNLFEDQPDGTENIQFHQNVLSSVFKLLQALFQDPFLIPEQRIILDILLSCVKCIENISTEYELITLNKDYKGIIMAILRGAHQEKTLLNALLMQHIEYLHRLVSDEHEELQMIGLSIILNFTSQDDDELSKFIIDDGFLDVFANMSQTANEDQLLLILKILYNITCCSDTCEFKKLLGEDNIVEFYLSCLEGHTYSVSVIALSVLNNLFDSNIISLTSLIIENNDFLQIIVDFFQTNNIHIIKQASTTLGKAIAELQNSSTGANDFIDKLISEFNLYEELEEYLENEEDHQKIVTEAPEFYVIHGELARFIESCNQEQDEQIISYQVQNSDDQNENDGEQPEIPQNHESGDDFLA